MSESCPPEFPFSCPSNERSSTSASRKANRPRSFLHHPNRKHVLWHPAQSQPRTWRRGIISDCQMAVKIVFKNMGRTFHFDCPHCQYRALVAGGADTGVNCVVQTIVCLDCRRLFDVFTRLLLREDKAEPPPATAGAKSRRKLLPTGVNIPPFWLVDNPWSVFASGRRSPAPPRQRRWAEVKPVCPIAGFHRIKIWNTPGRCPRCGNYLERNGLPYRLWD